MNEVVAVLPSESAGAPAERRLSAVVTSLYVRHSAGGVVLADIARLAAVDPLALAASDRVDLVQAWERVRAKVDGLQQRALAAVVDATEALGLDGEAARHEVGAALRLSPVTALSRTRTAADLVRQLPATLAALEAGDNC